MAKRGRGRPKGSKNKPKKEIKIKIGRPKKSKNKKMGRPKRSNDTPKDEHVKKKRGRPKGSKNKPKIIDVKTDKEKWTLGENHKFKEGDVVQDIDFMDRIGVISHAEKEYKMYSVKWHDDSPTNFQKFKAGTVHESFLKKSKKENPIDVPSWKKYPGPSAKEIERLQNKLKDKKETQEEVEKRIESLEEQYKKKRKTTKDIQETVEEDDFIDNIISVDEEEDLENLNDQLSSEEMYRRLKEELED